MKVLVVGGGGREHALCWAIAASPLLDTLWCAPGNAGIAEVADCVPIDSLDIPGLVAFAKDRAVDLVVVGGEPPLVAGLADACQAAGIRCFGPSRAAAQLEGSKVFTREIADAAGAPGAQWQRFTDPAAAKAYVRQQGAPIVVKADGLAAGKGVIVAMALQEAEDAVRDMLSGNAFGDAGARVVIEEFLDGEEASFISMVDGTTALPMATSQDHKRVGDGDTGPNTGGMGAYSPAPVVTPEVHARVMREVVNPTVQGMIADGVPFTGFLYAGLMIDAHGAPKVIEFNVRFGDPETQPVMLRLQSDLLPALLAACDGELARFDLRWEPLHSLVVVMAARGYPGSYAKGTEIRSLERAAQMPGVQIFHAGTARRGDGALIATGGRVLGVTATGATLAEAQAAAYAAVDAIDWPEGFCRRDIGWRAL
jgi:phosphoribosylamine--glycine ligase